MIIWRGWGIIVFVAIFGCLLIAQLAANSFSGSEKYWFEHGWPFACAFFAAGAVVAGLERLISRRGSRVLIDAQSGEQTIQSPANDLFFIPMRYWSFICGAIGVMVLLTGWSPSESRRADRPSERPAKVVTVGE